jgi:RHS repeat-associated protein
MPAGGRTDPWGVFNGGRALPAAQYCANLGHPTDAETGLVYMRARYYEPWTGRLLSEDPAMDGWNWYAYCGNEPVAGADPDGEARIDIGGGYWIEWQNKDGDLAWGDSKRQRGQYVGDGCGRLKHAKDEEFNNTVRKLLKKAKNPKVLRTLRKAGNIGLYGMVATTSLDAAFASDPAAFADIIDLVGGEWELFGGFITVTGDGY